MYSIDKQLEEQKNKPVEIDIHPVSKWKRILVYLGDMMFCFIAAFVIFNCATYPLATVIAPYDSEKSLQAAKDRDSVLYDNKILFYEDSSATTKEFSKGLKYTFNRFLAYFTFDDNNVYDTEHPEYTHIDENNVVYTYYVDIRNDVTTYNSIFNTLSDYFVLKDGNYTLKDSIKENTKYYFDVNERLQGNDYKTMSTVFNSIYGDMIKDIKKNDLTFTKDGVVISYNDNQKIIDNNSQIYYNRMSVSVFAAHIISVVLLFIVYPLVNRFGRTPMLSIFKADRIYTTSFKRLKTSDKVLSGIYSIFTTVPYVVFLPLCYTTLVYILDIPFLISFALVGFLLVIINLVVLLVSAFSQSLTDKASRVVIVPNEEFEQIEQSKY